MLARLTVALTRFFLVPLRIWRRQSQFGRLQWDPSLAALRMPCSHPLYPLGNGCGTLRRLIRFKPHPLRCVLAALTCVQLARRSACVVL